MRTVKGLSPLTAAARAAGVVTVTVFPPLPPVVGPMGLSLPKPTRLKSQPADTAEAATRRAASELRMASFIFAAKY